VNSLLEECLSNRHRLSLPGIAHVTRMTLQTPAADWHGGASRAPFRGGRFVLVRARRVWAPSPCACWLVHLSLQRLDGLVLDAPIAPLPVLRVRFQLGRQSLLSEDGRLARDPRAFPCRPISVALPELRDAALIRMRDSPPICFFVASHLFDMEDVNGTRSFLSKSRAGSNRGSRESRFSRQTCRIWKGSLVPDLIGGFDFLQ
jgi:hypothetical protein